jgi:hypothetical protein
MFIIGEMFVAKYWLFHDDRPSFSERCYLFNSNQIQVTKIVCKNGEPCFLNLHEDINH